MKAMHSVACGVIVALILLVNSPCFASDIDKLDSPECKKILGIRLPLNLSDIAYLLENIDVSCVGQKIAEERETRPEEREIPVRTSEEGYPAFRLFLANGEASWPYVRSYVRRQGEAALRQRSEKSWALLSQLEKTLARGDVPSEAIVKRFGIGYKNTAFAGIDLRATPECTKMLLMRPSLTKAEIVYLIEHIGVSCNDVAGSARHNRGVVYAQDFAPEEDYPAFRLLVANGQASVAYIDSNLDRQGDGAKVLLRYVKRIVSEVDFEQWRWRYGVMLKEDPLVVLEQWRAVRFLGFSLGFDLSVAHKKTDSP